MKSEEHQKALELFEKREYKQAAKIFKKLNLQYEYGYCEFAQGNINKAKSIWDKSKIDSPAIQWGSCIVNLMNNTFPIKISALQIRNFLERDLDVLLWNDQFDCVDKILFAEKILFRFNPETYKFLGRVILNYGYFDLGYNFLLKAEEICYSDPEVQVLIAKYFVLSLKRPKAIEILENLIKTKPDYYPARCMLENLYEEMGCSQPKD